jgi:hypothetical protein
MKIPGIVAVMVLSAASMWAQAATTEAPAATDSAKPAHHACMRGKSEKMGAKKMCHCMKNKDGMAKDMDGDKKGKCPRMKKDNENKS